METASLIDCVTVQDDMVWFILYAHPTLPIESQNILFEFAASLKKGGSMVDEWFLSGLVRWDPSC